MLSIQVGARELYNNPKSFYFFTGPDYGVKQQYLQFLKNKYNDTQYEYEDFKTLYDSLRKKSLIPRVPTLYVVRYDSTFLSQNINLSILKISGTIVGIYEDDGYEKKLDKKYPDNVIRFNHMAPAVVFKHLCKSYLEVPTNLCEFISKLDIDFYESQLMCLSLSQLPKDDLETFTKADVVTLFDYNQSYNNLRFKKAILSRNFRAADLETQRYQDDKSMLIYDILSAYLEVLKCLENSHRDSYAQDYTKYWDTKSVKRMYEATFNQIDKLRNYPSYDAEIAISYILGLLQFKVA